MTFQTVRLATSRKLRVTRKPSVADLQRGFV
ncbi:Uncharacterised protein [Mycobacteroides abscessus subsp. abscessus]|nr:Uncharacterised protein [Mycobacteroides abscessus subsp. abscessus]